ncbi:MAG TPA: pilus assembly PilX N-terminal domain-containing protein [Acidobacteriota bacterium]|nr:pilus assembly PilX N-terminal domain-containing protein [Acidobacteriota bacterium]
MSAATQGRNDRPGRPDASGASGNAMVVALLVLMLMTTAGVAFVAVTKSEKQIAGNQMAVTQAMYTAEAGITEALFRMSHSGDAANFIGPPLPYQGWGKYLVTQSGNSSLDPDAKLLADDGWDNDNDSYVDETNERYAEALSKQPNDGTALRYPYVRVEYKMRSNELVRFGDHDANAATPPAENLVVGAPVLRITALGQKGNANKVIEAEAIRFPFVDVSSAIWSGGSMKLNGNALIIDGRDHEMTAPYDTIPDAPAVPAIMTEGPTTDAPLDAGQENNVIGAGGDGSVYQSPFTYDFNQILAQAGGMVDYKLAGGTSLASSDPPLGSLLNPKLTLCDGNLDISGTWSGAGILVVNGNLKMTGGCQFTGIVVCLGDLSLAGGGPADVAHIIGGLIYQGTVIDDSSVGGAGRVRYSSGAVNNALRLSRYTLASWRER